MTLTWHRRLPIARQFALTRSESHLGQNVPLKSTQPASLRAAAMSDDTQRTETLQIGHTKGVAAERGDRSMTGEPHDSDTSTAMIYGHAMTRISDAGAETGHGIMSSGQSLQQDLGIVVRAGAGLSDEVRQQILAIVKAHRS